MRPYDVSSEEQNIAMESDNHPQDYRVWSILNHSDKVTLHPPANSDWVGFVEIPRAEFNVIVDWYMTQQEKTSNPAPATCDMCGGTGLYGPDAVNCPCGITPAPAAQTAGEPWGAYTVDYLGCEHCGSIDRIKEIAAAGSMGPTEVVYLYAGQPPQEQSNGDGECFTVVFRGNLRKLQGNPHHFDTQFGPELAVGMGNAFDEAPPQEQLEAKP